MWYYSINGTQRGPLTDKEFLREVNDGLIEPDTLVWNDELNEWREAQNVPGLLAPEDAASRPGAGLREVAEYGMFRDERHWRDADPSPPAGSNAAQEARYKNSPHYEPNPSFFSFRGRLGRLAHFLQSIAVMGVLIIAIAGTTATLVVTEELVGGDGLFLLSAAAMVVVYAAAAVLLVFVSIKRLHDLDLSGWFYLVMLIPFVSFLFALYMLFAPGTDGPNRYGPVPS
ncbi:MAG: DUF805 domain-containing protein [Longimonas sp.]|uniref:DUF805 domain-containing protein n=1 Tax=Longimonas sp. TaxID=2039626 RepID=UPI0039752F55